MKKSILALTLALFLVITPMSLPAQSVCLNPRVVAGVTVCLDSPLDPLIEPLVPPIIKPTSNPPSKPPSNNGGGKTQSPSKSGSQSKSGGSKATSPKSAQSAKPTPAQRKAAAEKKAKADKKKAKSSKPTPTVEPGGREPPEIQYRFETYPWYFWVTIIFTLLGVGWLLFYDTDPDKEGRSLIDKAKKRMLR